MFRTNYNKFVIYPKITRKMLLIIYKKILYQQSEFMLNSNKLSPMTSLKKGSISHNIKKNTFLVIVAENRNVLRSRGIICKISLSDSSKSSFNNLSASSKTCSKYRVTMLVQAHVWHGNVDKSLLEKIEGMPLFLFACCFVL